MKSAGWETRAAKRVADLCTPWLTELAKEKPADAQKQRSLLRGLGKQAELMNFLEDHPETAGLLAGVDDPQRVVRTFTSAPSDYNLIAGLYVLHADPDNADRLAEALDRHGSLICRLIRRGMLGAELLFLYRRGGEAADEYDRWLAEELTSRISSADEERTAFQVFLLDQGELLRQRLRTDAHFRSIFRSELWPKLARVAETEVNWMQYAAEPYLWDLLALPEGEQLLQKRGRLPIVLLFEDGCYPTELRSRIIRILLGSDKLLPQAVVKFRTEPLFRKLLMRQIPGPVMTAALTRLFRAVPNYAKELGLFNRLDDAALAEEVGPPPDGIQTWIPLYDTYYLGKKLYQGRPPSAMDWVLAAADPASFLLPELKLSGMVEKVLPKKPIMLTLKDEGQKFLGKQLKRQASLAGARITADEAVVISARLLEKGLEYEAASYGITALLSRSQAPLRQALTRTTTVEVTAPLRVLFRYSGRSRNTFLRLTGLEARLFMRKEVSQNKMDDF